jgi:uncharacterized Fe-S center protein
MKSKVYFIRVLNSDSVNNVADKLRRLLKVSDALGFIRKGEKAVLKMHFGEDGNVGFVRPEYVRLVCEAVRKKDAECVLLDTNTLYRGRRTNSRDHLELAREHGFTLDNVGAQVLIPDETQIDNVVEVEINGKFIKKAKILKIFKEADAIVDIAHFKGHIMTGFGGVLKNIGMGCATREGKLTQHSDVSPIVYKDNCVGCGACEEVCPVKAITIKDKKSQIDAKVCIGCASCIAACKYHAIDVNWEAGGSSIQEKMVEYAGAVLKGKKKKVACINFALKITKECDCLAKDDPRIAADTGIFISSDPVSADKAALDMVNQLSGKDVFKEAHPKRDGMKQLVYAQELGLGNLDYELIEVS